MQEVIRQQLDWLNKYGVFMVKSQLTFDDGLVVNFTKHESGQWTYFIPESSH